MIQYASTPNNGTMQMTSTHTASGVPLIFFFRKWALLLLLPVVEVFHIAYVIVIGPLSITGKYRWKDRQIR